MFVLTASGFILAFAVSVFTVSGLDADVLSSSDTVAADEDETPRNFQDGPGDDPVNAAPHIPVAAGYLLDRHRPIAVLSARPGVRVALSSAVATLSLADGAGQATTTIPPPSWSRSRHVSRIDLHSLPHRSATGDDSRSRALRSRHPAVAVIAAPVPSGTAAA
ncbi:hypothetical protein [Actinoplanes regularis]|uniref:hypothetical protein n=1 Tax=Actinoplanes regularis TaxID=52697 RepID=UPI0024A564C5|nr:hypothetical protein [Actinoplanes regularis]GLW35251.1 hypothetical protein Areg01_81870 [Actinoplanes regularis]